MSDLVHNLLIYIPVGISAISIIINLIILKIKKIPIKKVIKCISLLPSIISNAEKVFPLSNEGENKHDLVRALFDELLCSYGVERYSKYIDVDNLIEEVLKCPQKKLN